MVRPTMLRAKSIAALVPNKMASFLFSSTGLQKVRRRRRTIIKSTDSCRDLNDTTEGSSEDWEEDYFVPDENMTLLQAKSLVSQLERELSKQKKAKCAVMAAAEEDLAVAEARRASGCRRGFLLSLSKMKKHQRDCEVFAQAIECLETLLLVISTEVSQVQAIAELSGKEPAELKLFLTVDSLRTEIDCIISEPAPENTGFDEQEHLFRELKSAVPLPIMME